MDELFNRIAESLEELASTLHSDLNHNGGSGDISVAASLFELTYQQIETNGYRRRIANALETLAEANE